MRFLITGGSGLVGSHLIPQLLEEGHEVFNLSRSSKGDAVKGLSQVKWDGKSVPGTVPPVDVVINLAGASVGQRWNDSYKKTIMDSRVDATRACVDYIQRCEPKPQSFLSASGINFYGDHFPQTRKESDPVGEGFMAEVCGAWEAEAMKSPIRTVRMRIAPVLSQDGGPLEKLLTPYKLFVGGPVGSGDQGFPWIHLDDLVRGIHFFFNNPKTEGAYNLTAPRQDTAGSFAKELGNALNRPSFFRLPKAILQLVFGEMSVILWGGGFASADKMVQAGFPFKFPNLKDAFADLVQ